MSAEDLYVKWAHVFLGENPEPWDELLPSLQRRWSELLSSLNPSSGKLFYARRVIEYVGPETWLRNTLDRAIRGEMVLPNGGVIRSVLIQPLQEVPEGHQPLKKL